MLAPLGKWLVAMGLVLVVTGLAMWGLGGLGWIGRLPGDIYIRRGNVTFYFPLATGILLSIVISLLLMLLRR
jgi:thiosulfate reductase cytochrome b subunit